MALNFVEKGEFSKKGENIRKRKAIDEISDSTIRKVKKTFTHLKPPDPVPTIEWWDNLLLIEGKKTFNPLEQNNTENKYAFPDEFNIEYYAITEKDINIVSQSIEKNYRIYTTSCPNQK